ncbi:metal-dependent hydrolase family protein [Shimia aestuarii]|uniref:Imidazolonepropionase n=1 Tax=Shimia aestuarii TaxID=254406 RepID=A0A1I4RPA0_9RHOB|nr:amidohydrolase family protein [Shimia aestuarii]SFM53999.1 Imidazolonepropionase [Shimia aestuarii]
MPEKNLNVRPTLGQDSGSPILFRNARIFNGKDETLLEGYDVLVAQGRIAKLAKGIGADAGWREIDAEGRVLSPGFIDAHAHVMFQMSFPEAFGSDEFYWAYKATAAAETYLMNGFTTIRDVGGNTFSLKKNIDAGVLAGPRIYPSGPMISQTSGHSDHRQDCHKCAAILNEPSVPMKYHMVAVADGHDGVLLAVREAFRRGASQIKICTTGGTGSYADPLDVTQFLPSEVQAAVAAAKDWGTYVCTHAYHDEGIRRAVENGVQCVEHANLATEATLRMMQEQGIWLSPQVIVYTKHPLGYTDDQKAKHDEAYDGIDRMMTAARKLGFEKIAFGSDIITDPELLARVNDEFKLRTKWFTPFEVMRQATALSGELLAMSGPRNPYKGKLGVIEEAAFADLLLIDGNPLDDIEILTRPAETLDLIMKNGVIHKNTLQR